MSSIVKSQVLDDATQIYREISDHQLAREQLMILEARAKDADFSNTRMFRLKELAVAAAQRESYADAERFAKATLDAAQSLPAGKFPSVRIIVIADAISHLADPEAVRLGLDQMNQIGADILQGEQVDDRLHRRLVDIFLGAL